MRFALCTCAALALASVTRAQDPKEPAFPRRLLFVQIADYPALNPLTHAAPGGPDRTRERPAGSRPDCASRTRRTTTNSSCSPTRLAVDAHPPTRDVLAKALTDFCATTRAQDRIVIYFGVHAVEIDGKAFVIPIYGDPTEPATLLPVADVYAHLKELKAAQKVVIWDVCRMNPERVRGRRDLGPMTPALFKALTAAPEGVLVLVGCSPGEHATEYFVPHGSAGAIPGSVYLDALRQAAADDRAANPMTAPGDAIPMGPLHRTAMKSVAAVTKGQTPALAGKPGLRGADYDPKEAPAKRFAFPALPKGLPTAEVKAIFDELAMPAILEGDGSLVRFPFTEAALKEYAADVSVDDIFRNAEKYPLRIATLRAFQAVRNGWRFNGKEQLAIGTLQAPINDRTKKAVTTAQESVARALLELELELDRLVAVADKREKETKRWQAHYDYAVAELRLRVVLLNESNRALGHVKTEALPDLPAGSPGWRLVPSVKIEGPKDLRAMYSDADEGFARLEANHKGTPWEVLAKLLAGDAPQRAGNRASRSRSSRCEATRGPTANHIRGSPVARGASENRIARPSSGLAVALGTLDRDLQHLAHVGGLGGVPLLDGADRQPVIRRDHVKRPSCGELAHRVGDLVLVSRRERERQVEHFVREHVRANVRQLRRRKPLLLFRDPLQSPVSVAKDDAVVFRCVYRVGENAHRHGGELRQVGAADEIVAVEHHHLLAGHRSTATHEGVAGAAGFGLPHGYPVSHMGLLREVIFDLLGEVIDDDHEPLDRWQRSDDPVEDRALLHRQERLGHVLGVRTKACALTGREDDDVHTWVPRNVGASVRSDTLRRFRQIASGGSISVGAGAGETAQFGGNE